MERRGLSPDRATEIFVARFVEKNHWRVASTMTREDLTQEAWMVWWKIYRRYKPTSQRSQMALFMTSLTRHVHTLATKSGASRDNEIAVDDPCSHDTRIDEGSEGLILAALRSLPREIADVVKALIDDANLNALRLPHLRRRGGWRETTDEYLCRVLNLPENVPIRALLRRALADVL